MKQEKKAQPEEQEEYSVDMNNPHVKLLMDSVSYSTKKPSEISAFTN